MGANDAVHSALSTEYVQTLLRIKARQLARRPEFRRTDPADIEHDLIVHVLKQAGNYDPARSAPNTFITRVVETAAAMLVRDRGRMKRRARCPVISLERTNICRDQRQMTLGDVVGENDLRRRCGGRCAPGRDASDLRTDIAVAIESLPSELQRVALCLTNSGETAAAKELGVSRRQVRKAIGLLRSHFEDLGMGRPVVDRAHRPQTA